MILQQGVMDVWCPKCEFAACPDVKGGFFSTAVQLAQRGGIPTLWRGLGPTLVMSIPANTLYFTCYDELSIRVRPLLGDFTPLLAGTSARLVATAAVSPIELLRTKQQHSGKQLSVMLRGELDAGGVRSLFRGLAPTLWRDVPFSAVYWVGYEKFRAMISRSERLRRFTPDNHLFLESFVSGASSAFIAATLTHPFDLIKTRKQIEVYALDAERKITPATITSFFRTIVREEGPRGLFIGWGPRVSKIVPACAIMISTYEFAKRYFHSGNALE
jgi:solute carrier family 25 protein 39/40